MMKAINEITGKLQDIMANPAGRLQAESLPKYMDLGKVFDGNVSAGGWASVDIPVDVSWVRWICAVMQVANPNANTKVSIRRQCPTAGAPSVNMDSGSGASGAIMLIIGSSTGSVVQGCNSSPSVFGSSAQVLIYNGHTADQNMKIWLQLQG